MKDEEIENLLGGFATDTLSDRERELLYTAALKSQDLFNALADDQALHELLSDPASRRELLQSLQPVEPGLFERLTGWMRRPAIWAVAGSVMAAMLVVVAVRHTQQMPQQAPASRDEVAKFEAPKATGEPANQPAPSAPPMAAPSSSAAPAPPAPPPVSPVTSEDRLAEKKRADAPAVGGRADGKMKVAVLDFDSGAAQPKEAKEKDQAPEKDVGKEASEMLGKKLDSIGGYAVIDRKQVTQALQDQNLNNRQLNSTTAARVGRSLGADAVIVGSVKPAAEPAAKSALSSNKVGALSRSRVSDKREFQVKAQAINPQTAQNVASAFAQTNQAPAGAAGGLNGAVDQVASSLGQQIQTQQNKIKIEGLVTDVNDGIVTLNVGAKAGVRTGDRLDVRRDGKPAGHIVIDSVKDATSVGKFQGESPAQIGDAVSN